MATSRVGIDALLARLDPVQKTGNGWRCNCPTGHRTRGTLSLAQGDSGAILLHCFSGCAVSDVLGALGLSMGDIQPARLRDESPEGRRAARAQFRLASVQSAAAVLEREGNIVLIAAGDLLRADDFSPADFQRLVEAVERVAAARAVLS